MIKVIKNSEVDRARISHIFTPIDTRLKHFDFSHVVVNKPWGYEYLMYQNDQVSIWVLYLKPGYLTSMHCHLNKKTALIVLSGEAVCTTLENGFRLKESDGLVLDKKVFHSTQAVSQDGLFLMEIETPSQKTDLLRLSDNYNRESRGYESQEEMSKDISRYEYIFFDKNEFGFTKHIRSMNISIEKITKTEELFASFGMMKKGLGIVVGGGLIDEETGETLSLGDIIDFSHVRHTHKFTIPSSAEILMLEKNDR